MITLRVLPVVGAGLSAIALCGGAAPAFAGVAEEPVLNASVSTTQESSASAALEKSPDYSGVSLAGAGSAFLILGLGTATVAHRRRWSGPTQRV